MVEERMPRGDVNPGLDPPWFGRRAFNQWLRAQLNARKLTESKLAQKSGVDHSTISLLMREDREPSLRTTTLLARGLGMVQDVGSLDDAGLGRSGSPAAWVEYALRSDDLLSEAGVREIMDVYLAARLGRPQSVATPARVASKRSAPVSIVVEVPAARGRSG